MSRPSPSLRHALRRFVIFHGAGLGLSILLTQNSVAAMPLALMAEIILPQSSSDEIGSAAPTAAKTPHAFPISESELRDLAQTLAPKVDLFRAVWEEDPEAEFFAGTTRDYLYWILGHFKGLENLGSSTNGTKQSDAGREKIEAIKAKLLAIPFIKFNEIVGPESDADIMTKNREALEDLRAADFAIRKLDFISFDRALPGQPMYQDEINQGYIPSEKIRLSKNGISTDLNFGNGVSDLLTGNLSIHFPDTEKFWNTYYAKEGANHPLLLALRYVRILAQDYLQRHGSEIPNAQKLQAPISKEIKKKIQALVQEAITDISGSFRKFLQNRHGKKWLNASIKKSFRSFTNANAAFDLMKELGIIGLIEVYPEQIESAHQYLLKIKRNETEIAENFRKFGITPNDLYEKIADYLPDLELYHGTVSELAFRNIIYQGVIPSERGSAGRGLYGVSKKDLEFAKNWSKGKSGQDDLVIALKLKATTKIVDITKGSGKEIFERWKKSKNEEMRNDTDSTITIPSLAGSSTSPSKIQDLYDAFAENFGIDILKYPYTNRKGQTIVAFVLKSSQAIESRRGVFKNPRPLSELLSEAEKAKRSNDQSFLKDFLETPLTKDERNKIISILGDLYFQRAFEEHNFQTLKKILNLKLVSLLEFLLQSTLTSVHALVWNEVRALLKDKRADVRKNMTESLLNCPAWPPPFWNEVPALLRDRSEHVRQIMAKALEQQSIWPPLVWNEVPAILKDANKVLQRQMIVALHSSSPWPPPVWNEVHALLMDNDDSVRSMMTAALASKPSWPTFVWDIVPVLLKDRNENVRQQMNWALQNQSIWPHSVWNEVPALLKDTNQFVSMSAAWALRDQSIWPHSVWDEISALLKGRNANVRRIVAETLRNQHAWPQDIINFVAKSDRPEFIALKKLKPSILDPSSCGNSLGEIATKAPREKTIESAVKSGEASP